MQINIASYVLRSSNGSIDHESTLGKFANDLLTFELEQEAETSTIGAAIHALFDKFKGARLNLPYLSGEVARSMNVPPDQFNAATAKIQAFVRSQSQGKSEGGVEQYPNSVFVIGRGAGGGVARRADLPAKK